MRQKVFGNKMSCRGLRPKTKRPLGAGSENICLRLCKQNNVFLGPETNWPHTCYSMHRARAKVSKNMAARTQKQVACFFPKLAISSCYSARRAEARGPNIKCARATKTKTVGVWWKLGTRILERGSLWGTGILSFLKSSDFGVFVCESKLHIEN